MEITVFDEAATEIEWVRKNDRWKWAEYAEMLSPNEIETRSLLILLLFFGSGGGGGAPWFLCFAFLSFHCLSALLFQLILSRFLWASFFFYLSLLVNARCCAFHFSTTEHFLFKSYSFRLKWVLDAYQTAWT